MYRKLSSTVIYCYATPKVILYGSRSKCLSLFGDHVSCHRGLISGCNKAELEKDVLLLSSARAGAQEKRTVAFHVLPACPFPRSFRRNSARQRRPLLGPRSRPTTPSWASPPEPNHWVVFPDREQRRSEGLTISPIFHVLRVALSIITQSILN
jgi:hypothetical protein